MTTKPTSAKRPTKRPPKGRGKAKGQTASVAVHVHLVSESTGCLARHMCSVGLSQFPLLDHQLHEHTFCTSGESLKSIRSTIATDESPLVFSALTKPRLKRALATWCERQSINHFHLVESVVAFLSNTTGLKPINDATRIFRAKRDS